MTAAVAAGNGREYGLAMDPSSADFSADAGRGQSQQDLEHLVLGCNKDGMDFLRKGQYKQAFEQLKYAEAMVEAKQGQDALTNLMSVTCNNLGCYYKKVGKLHAALSYLRKALKIEVSLQTDDVTVAGTHLNVCAILSKLDKHDKAVQHALCALELISNRVNSSGNAASQDEHSVLAIAYHNVAVERDYMHQWEEAAAAYQQGHQVARQCLGEQHPLTQTLGKNADAALQKSHRNASRTEKSSTPGTSTPAASQHRRGKGGASPGTYESSSQAPILPEISGASGRGSKSLEAQRSLESQAEDSMTASIRQDAAAADWDRGAWRQPAGQGETLPPLQSERPFGVSQYGYQHMASPGGFDMSPQQEPSPLGMMPTESVYAGTNNLEDTLSQQNVAASKSPAKVAPKSFFDSMGEVMPSSGSPPPLVMDAKAKLNDLKLDPPTVPVPAPPASEPPASARGRPNRERPAATGAFAPPSPTSGGATASGGRPPRVPGSAANNRAARELARNGGDRAPAAPLGRRDQAVVAMPQQSQLLRKSAAEKIQRFWREYYRKKNEGSDRRTRENACATRIQARWRAFHVLHSRQNKASTSIQKWVRGFLVRLAIKRHKAAVIIQRYATGMITRRNLREAAKAVVQIQKRMRAIMAKAEVEAKRQAVQWAKNVAGSCVRRYKALEFLEDLRRERDQEQAKLDAAIRIQSSFRGGHDRDIVKKKRERLEAAQQQVRAAVKVQAAARAFVARKRVAQIRRDRLLGMHRAATAFRKHWLAYIHRKRYLELKKEFAMHEKSVVTLQRYVRGYLVRLRMWRNAIQAEEQLWAAVEIQRCWRGYLGRLRWELEYEAVWSRDAAALRLQRSIRGWLARTQVHRRRKRLARAEFEKARRRFKSAQKIQALVRGVQCRKRIAAFRSRKVKAALDIQRIFRGHQLRSANWEKEHLRRIVQIQSLARGFLVRSRRFQLLAKVVMIQRNMRRWQRYIPEAERRRRLQHWKQERQAAKTIQRGFREKQRWDEAR
eukprot:TRINITY_DN26249_c0_g1_i1.p1 TRINITY_DN26249_c0_g1~~TRINITY_DN26249_c0_g1_i1.p1  ORF type:complete len:1009 (+),score=203.17 TRINITY_DN26249_c0_g1_i1:70-3096(+)